MLVSSALWGLKELGIPVPFSLTLWVLDPLLILEICGEVTEQGKKNSFLQKRIWLHRKGFGAVVHPTRIICDITLHLVSLCLVSYIHML